MRPTRLLTGPNVILEIRQVGELLLLSRHALAPHFRKLSRKVSLYLMNLSTHFFPLCRIVDQPPHRPGQESGDTLAPVRHLEDVNSLRLSSDLLYKSCRERTLSPRGEQLAAVQWVRL